MKKFLSMVLALAMQHFPVTLSASTRTSRSSEMSAVKLLT